MDNQTPRKAYPAIDPYETGRLDVGDGHEIYYEVCGNPRCKPVVFLHGGPGSGASPQHRRLFDPDRYRIILLDQRGCGRSTPLGRLEANTTWHLVDDLERLRTALDVERWVLFGGSWGATLALAYAEAYPAHVLAMILRGVFSGRPSELAWFYESGANRLFPDQWENFLAQVPADEQGDIIGAYRKRLTDPDRAVRAAAAAGWTQWESATVMLRSNAVPNGSRSASDSTIAFARIENHYFYHGLWLDGDQLIANADRLADIPGVIVQGRYDIVTPAITSWQLAQAWPRADYRMVEGAGHAFAEPGVLQELLAATDRFAD
ncbi:prolyl aminopeptidase [Fulvimarina sp. 2208YS6-2-32]|uniref:Proline iminopeptidase n=1 Tax=Fulvimarina uroteuthidis TaxID=3098149 RepID=A0ABU5I518_9HYPH|nr:prolyl aminopeptidase [Fulvimarina sp. 2208YS6-2-32]MDY8110480.1 prolyl aminopeptidase [Fulvimarina sp. 2208YS6-2-32]